MAIASLGLALATWVSQLGRAVAICVSIYVGFSIGWMILIGLIVHRPESVVVPLMMGSPLSGTAAATRVLCDGPNQVAGSELRFAAVGAVLWIIVHSGAAALLFAATVATFDHCMGRISENARIPGPQVGKKHPAGVKSDLEDWLDDDLVATGKPTQ